MGDTYYSYEIYMLDRFDDHGCRLDTPEVVTWAWIAMPTPRGAGLRIEHTAPGARHSESYILGKRKWHR